ncbi:cobalamin B12-binding domain-containing protein [Desulfatirhabdium butyrativorans]|uniref:cobalamin B12-binding domain-containing protein n=1 Tax=Desulfatirhabdium butyrativorans TaxID=340467 RepID=UPI000412DEC7|nr:B12-binding domain-containing protein [Desulfatirhabdium butyrativorans]
MDAIAGEIPDGAIPELARRVNDARNAYLQALLAGSRKQAFLVIQEARKDGLSIMDIYVDVFQAAMYEIGRLWETNIITVADEHMATAITQYIMSLLYQEMDIPQETSGRAVITGVQGELHQIGPNMVADVLEAEGWNVRFLGTNVPPDGILEAIDEHHAGLFGLSMTMFFHLPNVIELVRRIRTELHHVPACILLGGAAFRMLSALPGELDGCHVAMDLRDALRKTRLTDFTRAAMSSGQTFS